MPNKNNKYTNQSNKYTISIKRVRQPKLQVRHFNQKNTPSKTPSTPSQYKEYANKNTKYVISIKRIRQPKHQVRHLNQNDNAYIRVLFRNMSLVDNINSADFFAIIITVKISNTNSVLVNMLGKAHPCSSVNMPTKVYSCQYAHKHLLNCKILSCPSSIFTVVHT